MQPRPVRSQIYLPVLRFGITDEDWGFVIIAAVLGYAVPFLLGMNAWNVPLEIVGWVITMGLTILSLNIIRRKSRPAWLRHVIQAKLQGEVSRRRLPGASVAAWLKQDQESE
ncbi:MAG: hypothetical protein AB7U82_13005 [Blastocatellales bacterium]